ncbi:rhomboid family intramembrane serine protease [Anaeromyxobacter dehalogenans]|nr:rhomboid family intramembrane serine protease [Anaeromyxobacter dehalogenans]
MVALFAVISATPGEAPFASWGYRGDAFQVWSGAAWVLLVSAFIHQALSHLALNVYWLWTLGRAVEGAFGPRAMGLLLLTSAFVSSSFHLAIFDDVGVGASGMVFAVFGFGWLARGKRGELRATFTTKTGILFAAGLVGCWIVLTREVANGAHLGGLLFGAAAAEAVATGRRPRLAKAGAILLILLAFGVTVACPWSATWWSTKGHGAHARGQYDLAIQAYDMSLRFRPDQPWVMASLIRAYRASGNADAAASLLTRLRTVSPAEAALIDEEGRSPVK